MNKLFIVLLAVCLVSVSAFVKRDATETVAEKNYVDKFKQDVQDLTKNFSEIVSKTFDPETVKKTLEDVQAKFQEFTKSVTPTKPAA